LQFRRDQRSEGIQKQRRKMDNSSQSADDNLSQEQVQGLLQMAQVLRQGPPFNWELVQPTIVEIRKMLSKEQQPPIQSVINAGIVNDMMNLLQSEDTPAKIRFECAWALTNVASGASKHTRVVVDAGGLETFVHILANETGEIQEQAVWALGNIAGDCAELRDRVLRQNTLNYLLQLFVQESDNRELLRHATWTLSNFCRGKPHVDFEIVKPCLGLLKHLLDVNDNDILVDACWAVSYISDDPTVHNVRIQKIVDENFVPSLISLLDHQSALVIHPALRAIGNIVTGNDKQTQHVLKHGVLAKLKLLLESERVNIRKEACWTVSNITAGNASQIREVCEAQLIPLILQHLESKVFDIRKEACWAISNATTGGNNESIRYIVQCGAIKPLIGTIQTANVISSKWRWRVSKIF